MFLSDLRVTDTSTADSADALRLPLPGVVRLGALPVRVVASAPPEQAPRLTNTYAHLPPVRVVPHFTPSTIRLPRLPPQRATTRFPALAVAAPLLMATVWFLSARSPLSLMMLGASPAVALAAWLGAVLVAQRAHRRAHREFEAEVAKAEQMVAEAHQRERRAREEQHPATAQLLDDAMRRGPRLWGGNAEAAHPLTFRIGRGTSPSAVRTTAHRSADQPDAAGQNALVALQHRAEELHNAPVSAELKCAGAFAIVGSLPLRAAVLNSALAQLCTQYSPANLIVAGFFSPERQDASGWVAWLPHVDSPQSPLTVSHLSATAASAAALITALEDLTQLWHTADSRTTTAAKRPAVLVIVAHTGLVDRRRLVALADSGSAVGVHVVWCAAALTEVPANCSTVLELGAVKSSLHRISDENSVNLDSVESLAAHDAERFARSLASVVDAGAHPMGSEHALPSRVSLASLLPPDLLESAHSVAANWRLRDSVSRTWQRGSTRSSTSLTVPVGRDVAGPVSLDLVGDGPHALIGGTTGSGKSEFLVSWILSLAAHVAPDRLTFLFIDYKGGASFLDCASLPHSVGLATDLDPHLAERVLISLRAEIRSRERALANAGAPDLDTMERNSNPKAPPRLLVVIDEFAALRQDAPEFLAGVTDLAQRGRSLGIHLILATQRPAGAISDDLRANANLRVSLRTADDADSRDLLGDSSAATFSPRLPGRAAWVLGAGSVHPFQSATTGVPPAAGTRGRVVIAPLWPESSPSSPSADAPAPPQSGPRDSTRLIATITRAAHLEQCAAPPRPWVEPLAPSYSLDEAAQLTASLAWPRLVVGVRDEPDQQRHAAFSIRLPESGNVAVFGGPGSGKTTALFTIAAATIRARPGTTVYGINGGDGTLTAIAGLPGVGSIARADAHEQVTRLCEKLAALSDERRHREAATSSPVLLLIDGFARLREADDRARTPGTVLSLLMDIARTARSSRVHLLLSAERAGGLPPDLEASFPERLALRPALPDDLHLMGLSRGALHSAPPGRAIRVTDGTEIQFALPGLRSENAVEGFTRAARVRPTEAPSAFLVPEIPRTVQRAALPPAPGEGAPFALNTATFRGISAPDAGLALVSGPAGSGRTTAIHALLEALTATRSEARSDGVTALLSPHRNSGLATTHPWHTAALTPAAQRTLLARLTAAVDAEMGVPVSRAPALSIPGPDGLPVDRHLSSPASWPGAGERGVLVIEDIGAFAGSGFERELGALLQRLRHSELLTIVEGENATLSSVWELATPLRGLRWALALRPDEHDTPSVFSAPFLRMTRADTPPGRGVLVRGADTHGVQVGLPDLASPARAAPAHSREADESSVSTFSVRVP